jgi:Cyclin, N-terminal domain/Cyclin, C-terminal domain
MKDSPSSSAPLLGLRMKTSAPLLRHHLALVQMDHEVMLDMLATMSSCEQTYKCGDYLSTRERPTTPLVGSCTYTVCSSCPESDVVSCADTAATAVSSSSSLSSSSSSSQQEQAAAVVDATCREKMCEWSYRVCDHFHTPREIVAFSMSFLDRFVDRCACDRTAFKLASMTTLYLATKVCNGKQISIGTLAELSRGEFDIVHIAEMERIILETLDWRLSPPTIQAFIGLLIHLIPPNDKFTREIGQRAIFFAELCAYDYSLILHDKSLLAVAAILNAIEGMDDASTAEDIRVSFLESVVHLDIPLFHAIDLEQLESTQTRLLYLYSCSAQLQAGGIPCLSSSSYQRIASRHHYHHHEDTSKGDSHHSHSPVSVFLAAVATTSNY